MQFCGINILLLLQGIKKTINAVEKKQDPYHLFQATADNFYRGAGDIV